jgi:hypothetical protein
MGWLVTLLNYRPAVRYDLNKWTSVRIYEGATADPDERVEIDSQALANYPDPLDPPVFNFTTVEATAPDSLWYWVEFHDEIGGIQDSTPEYNGPSFIPDTEWVRATSNVIFPEFGYPVPEPGEPDRLQLPLDEAVDDLQRLTDLDLVTLAPTDARMTAIRRAIRMLVEFNVARSQPEILESAVDFDMLQSMSADGYSETRRTLGVALRTLHPWPALNWLLNGIIAAGGGATVDEGAPAFESQGVHPIPFADIMNEGFIGSPAAVPNPYAPPQTVWPRVSYRPDGFES